MAAGLIDVVPKTASHCIVSEHIRLSVHYNTWIIKYLFTGMFLMYKPV